MESEINYRNWKYIYPSHHGFIDDNGAIIECGKTNEKGMCLNCGIYTNPLNPLPPITDDDIPF